MSSVWLLPAAVVGVAAVLSVPLGRYLAAVFDGRVRGPAWLRWVERQIDTGPQNWKRYAVALLVFSAVKAAIGFAVLALQPHHPAFLNPDGKGELAPSTLFHTTLSMLTNTQQQHYSGEIHFSYGSQLVFLLWMDFLSPAASLAALVAVARGLRGETVFGNFYVDVWRVIVYVLVPLSFLFALPLIAGGVPMTLDGAAAVKTLEGGGQTIARGPVAALESIKQLATNGGGFFGPNSAHPFENPTAWTNFVEMVLILLVPFAQVWMFGRMLGRPRHAAVLFGVMLLALLAAIGWCVYHDAVCPNPAFTGRVAETYRVPDPAAEGGQRVLTVPAVVPLPVEPSGWGNLEGKELRFGPGAGPAWAAMTTCTGSGSCNCMHDSLNPLAGLAPFGGMWLNCIFGGVGAGLLNLLVYVLVAVFLAGLMVGRTPEYLGKKVEAREMKLAALALLIHPVLVLGSTGLFAALEWGEASTANPGPHGFGEIVYEFSSASANNGSGFEGLGDTYGFRDPTANPSAPAPYSIHWDVACGLVLVVGRLTPMILLLALAGSLSAKQSHPERAGTLRTDTATFGVVLLGTILLAGMLLFLPVSALGPMAEHLGPIPFGR